MHHPIDESEKRGTVLIVDDEAQVLRTAAIALQRANYHVLTASSAAEAERVCRTHAGQIDAVVMDVVLQGSHGFDAIPCLRAILPDLKVMYISGYPGQLLFANQGIDAPFLFKPFTPEQLAEAVERLIAMPVATRAA